MQIASSLNCPALFETAADEGAMASAQLSSTHRYASGALFALALRQAQLQQHSPVGFGFPPVLEPPEGGESSGSHGDGDIVWSLEECGLVRHVFRYLGIDQKAWVGLESTSVSPEAKDHISAFLKLLGEEDGESEKLIGDEATLAKAVDAMVENQDSQTPSRTPSSRSDELRTSLSRPHPNDGESVLEALRRVTALLSPQRKVSVLFTLVAGCVADPPPPALGESSCGGDGNGVAALGKAGYDARQRVALRGLALWLNVQWHQVGAMERMVASMAMAVQKEKEQEEVKLVQEKETAGSRWEQWKRGGVIGAAALTGGALLAITGGLAAPAIAAGMAAIGSAVPILGAGGLSAAAAVAGSAAGSAAVAASFGVAGARLTGMKMARRISDIEEFQFEALGGNHQQGCLAIEIVVSGIAFQPNDFMKPWETSDGDLERYALRWETKNVIAVSIAVQDWLTTTATKEVMKRGAMYTVLAGLLSALSTPLSVLGATDLIDSRWAIAIDRSEKAGKLLAMVLLQGGQGSRPVTLAGYALGARVIFTCLEELAKHGNAGIGIVERVVLLGTPQTLDKDRWESVRKVVAGRFVNGFSTNDWVLGVVYRANFLSQGLAGLQAVDVHGIENVDLSEMVDGHTSYLTSLQHILRGIDIDSFYATQPHKLRMSDEDKKNAASTAAGPAPQTASE